MFWLILAVVIVGILIVRAINRSTVTNAVNNATIAQQQMLNSPEYRKQQQADMAYFRHLGDELIWKIAIAEDEIGLLRPPTSMYKDEYQMIGTTKVLSTNFNKVVKTKSEVIANLKERLKYQKKCLDENKKDYEEKKVEYEGYRPQNIATIRSQYELDVPFEPRIDESKGEYYFNEDKASSWSMYQEQVEKYREPVSYTHLTLPTNREV